MSTSHLPHPPPPPPPPPPHLSLTPKAGLVAARAAGGLLVLLASGLVEPIGRLLLLPAAAALLALCLRDLLLRPVVSADGTDLEVVDGWRRRRAPWAAVEGLRVVRDRRTSLLEIDLGQHLVVLSAHRLGTDPDAALLLLEPYRVT